MGFGGRPKMSPMRQTRHHVTCPVLMPDCTSTGPLQMETRYCPLADTLELDRKKERTTKKKACPAINFIKEGQTGKKTKAPTTSILDESDCWEMKVEIGKQLVFPNIIPQTSSRV